MTVRDCEIQFPTHGLVFVKGENKTAGDKMQSVAAGKTGLGEALSIAMTGCTGRYSIFGHYSPSEKSETMIEVEGILNGKPLIIQNGFRNHSLGWTGAGLRFRYGKDSFIERGHIKNTRQELSRVLGVSPALADWTVFIDGDRLKSTQLSQKETVDLLMDALGEPPWEEFHEKAKDRVRQLSKLAESCEIEYNSVLRDIKSRKESVESAEENLRVQTKILVERQKACREIQMAENAKREALENDISEYTAQKKIIKKQINEIEKAFKDDFKKLEQDRLSLKSSLRDLQSKRNSIYAKKVKLDANLSNLGDDIKALKKFPDTCPKCGQLMSDSHREKEDARIRELIEKEDISRQAILTELSALDRDIEKIESQIESLGVSVSESSSKTKELSHSYEEIDKKLSKMTFALASIGHTSDPDRGLVIRAETSLEERRSALQLCEEQLEGFSIKKTRANYELKIAEYWCEAYSPTGIPNHILRDSIRPMNSIAKKLSNLMTGGVMEIKYTALRETASGKEKNHLGVDVLNRYGACKLQGTSKGESGLANLIMSETLSSIGNVSTRVGFRWYDEVVNPQDPSVRQTILEYMAKIAHDKKILIFVVDHHKTVQKYADYTLTAVKDRKGTSYRWD